MWNQREIESWRDEVSEDEDVQEFDGSVADNYGIDRKRPTKPEEWMEAFVLAEYPIRAQAVENYDLVNEQIRSVVQQLRNISTGRQGVILRAQAEEIQAIAGEEVSTSLTLDVEPEYGK
jgi:hypothetical protein